MENRSSEQENDSFLDVMWTIFRLLGLVTIYGALIGAFASLFYYSIKTTFNWIGTFF